MRSRRQSKSPRVQKETHCEPAAPSIDDEDPDEGFQKYLIGNVSSLSPQFGGDERDGQDRNTHKEGSSVIGGEAGGYDDTDDDLIRAELEREKLDIMKEERDKLHRPADNGSKNKSKVRGTKNETDTGIKASVSLVPPEKKVIDDKKEPTYYYYDDTNTVQGPFTQSLMRKWYHNNYLPQTLMVQRDGKGPFQPMKALFPTGIFFV
jgi:hypothetical protein